MTSLITRAFMMLLFFALSTCSYSQKPAHKTWQYEHVRSEDFRKPVKAWFFSPRPEKVGSPSMAIQNKQIKWLHAAKAKALDLPEGYVSTALSKGGHFFGIIRLVESPKTDSRNKVFQLDLLDIAGEKLFSLSRKQYYDDSLPAVVVSNSDGSVIIGQNTSGKLWFYDSHGVLSKEVELFVDASYDLERVLHLDLSADGERLAVVASKRGASPLGSDAPHPSGEPHLFLFTHQGDEVWRKPLPDFNTSSVAISANGVHIIANSYTVDMPGNVKKTASLFDLNGETIARFDLLFKYAHFSPDSEFLLLAENSKALVVQLSTGNLVWSHTLPAKEGMITAGRLADKAEVAVLLVAQNEYREGAFVFTRPKLKVFDHPGNLHQEIPIKDETFEHPALKLSADHQYISIGFDHSYHIYEANK